MNEKIKKRFRELRNKVVAGNKAEGVSVQASVVDMFVFTMLQEEFGDDAVGDIKQYQKSPIGFWNNKENCIAEAQKYDKATKWRLMSPGSYDSAFKNGWLDECSSNFVKRGRPAGFWTKDRCMEFSSKFESVSAWKKASSSSYHSAVRHGWIKECRSHMKVKYKPKGYWTKERCMNDALNYKTISSWNRSSPSAINKARKEGWFKECSAHMERSAAEPGSLTLEVCIEDAKKYSRSSDWERYSASTYSTALRNGWLSKCNQHFTGRKKVKAGHWNLKENCMVSAGKYFTVKEWCEKDNGAYCASRKNGWHKECKAVIEANRKRKENRERANQKAVSPASSQSCSSKQS